MIQVDVWINTDRLGEGLSLEFPVAPMVGDIIYPPFWDGVDLSHKGHVPELVVVSRNWSRGEGGIGLSIVLGEDN